MIFLFDENLPEAIAAALGKAEVPARHVAEEGLRGAEDEVVLRYAGERGWYFVSADESITRRPELVAIIRSYGIGAFFFAGKARRSYLDWLTVVVNRWKSLVEFATANSAPFLARVPDRGAIRLLRSRRERRRK